MLRQAYGESGMTVLEELIDAAFRACDVGHAQGQQRVTGAALLTRSGKMCVYLPSSPGGKPPETEILRVGHPLRRRWNGGV